MLIAIFISCCSGTTSSTKHTSQISVRRGLRSGGGWWWWGRNCHIPQDRWTAGASHRVGEECAALPFAREGTGAYTSFQSLSTLLRLINLSHIFGANSTHTKHDQNMKAKELLPQNRITLYAVSLSRCKRVCIVCDSLPPTPSLGLSISACPSLSTHIMPFGDFSSLVADESSAGCDVRAKGAARRFHHTPGRWWR